MQRGQLHSKQVLKASLIIPPLTPRPGHVTQAADELGRVGWEGEGLGVGEGGAESDWLHSDVLSEVGQSAAMTCQ